MPDSSDLMPISHRSVVEEVAAELERQISLNILRPGERITEESLTSRWAISRTALREAFRLMEGRGFVTRYPRRGVFVTEINPTLVREVYTVRAELEALAIKLAVINATPEDVEDLRLRTEAMRCASERDDRGEYLELDQAIHERLTELSGNAYLFSVLNPINKLTKRYRSAIFYHAGDYTDSTESHEEILEYFAMGDPDHAGMLRRQRVLTNGERVARHFEANREAAPENGSSLTARQETA